MLCKYFCLDTRGASHSTKKSKNFKTDINSIECPGNVYRKSGNRYKKQVGNFEYFGTAHKVVLWRFSFDEKLRFEFLEICNDEWNLTASMEFREKMTASWDITTFLKIYYRKFPFHLTLLQKFSVEWFSETQQFPDFLKTLSGNVCAYFESAVLSKAWQRKVPSNRKFLSKEKCLRIRKIRAENAQGAF